MFSSGKIREKGNLMKAQEAIREFAYADRITAKSRALRREELDECDRPIGRVTYAHAYSTSYYAMSDGTMCAVSDITGDGVRYVVDWREW